MPTEREAYLSVSVPVALSASWSSEHDIVVVRGDYDGYPALQMHLTAEQGAELAASVIRSVWPVTRTCCLGGWSTRRGGAGASLARRHPHDHAACTGRSVDMTTTVEHQAWCEDQTTGHDGACRFYGDSLSGSGVVVTSTAEAVDGGAMVVLTTTGRNGRLVRLVVAPAAASSFGRALTRLGLAFEDRVPRRSHLTTTATARGGVVVSR